MCIVTLSDSFSTHATVCIMTFSFHSQEMQQDNAIEYAKRYANKPLLSPHLPITFTQRAIHIHRPCHKLTTPFRTSVHLKHLNPPLQQLLDLILPPLLLPLLDSLHHLPDLLLLVAALVRLAIPALL